MMSLEYEEMRKTENQPIKIYFLFKVANKTEERWSEFQMRLEHPLSGIEMKMIIWMV
jgi:hypothetical protein